MGRSHAKLSVVVPCFNEIEVIAVTHERLSETLSRIEGVELELVYVDDGSSDGTDVALARLADADDRVTAVILARNFGHQRASTAGLAVATGDAVVLLDADLQDPPEVVLEMFARWQEGWDVAFGRRRSRVSDSAFKRLTASVFYRLMRIVSDVPVPIDAGDFRLMDRAVVDALLALPEQDRFLRGMVAWLGFRQTDVPFDRPPRAAGVSKYPLRRMLALAGDGLFGFSTIPLRATAAVGLLTASLAGLAGLATLLAPGAWGWERAGLLALCVMGAVTLLLLSMLAEYVGRLFREAKDRPLYVVREVRRRRADLAIAPVVEEPERTASGS